VAERLGRQYLTEISLTLYSTMVSATFLQVGQINRSRVLPDVLTSQSQNRHDDLDSAQLPHMAELTLGGHGGAGIACSLHSR
jgi:hypothetical protein